MTPDLGSFYNPWLLAVAMAVANFKKQQEALLQPLVLQKQQVQQPSDLGGWYPQPLTAVNTIAFGPKFLGSTAARA